MAETGVTWSIPGVRGANAARARVRGNEEHPSLHGTVDFYELGDGVLVMAEVSGLPAQQGACGGEGVYGFHIHAGTACTGTEAEPFMDADGHFNPANCQHPYHAGDMPPLFGNGGKAWMAFYTVRFKLEDVIGRTVIVHAGPDDFKTQPSGNSGAMIGCGIIRKR